MFQTLRAETPVYGGYIIARSASDGGKVIFVKGAIPGELVEISIEERKKDYCVASVEAIIEPSSFRREPPCKVFGRCGGCQIQFIEYEKQVSIKEEILIGTMGRIGGVDVQLMPSLTDAEFRYRRRGQFKISQAGELGFYRRGSRDVIPVAECPLMVDEINDALHRLNGIGLKGLKEVHVIAGDTVAVLMKGNITDDLCQEVLAGGISGIALETGDSLGKDYITLDLHGLKYSVTPWSFFQGHWPLNRKVVETVVGRLAPLEGKRILDLYSGAGNFSLPLAAEAGEVIAVEENQYAVEDGRRNAMLNGIKNCSFVHASVEGGFTARDRQKLSKLFVETRYDIVVVDPPRPGLTADCLKRILEIGSGKIVYVSCNPATLARDIRKMNEIYELESLSLIDFFPNTYHIEALAILRRKGGS